MSDGYTIVEHYTKAHGRYWTLASDGMPFGLRYFTEEEAQAALDAKRYGPASRPMKTYGAGKEAE